MKAFKALALAFFTLAAIPIATAAQVTPIIGPSTFTFNAAGQSNVWTCNTGQSSFSLIVPSGFVGTFTVTVAQTYGGTYVNPPWAYTPGVPTYTNTLTNSGSLTVNLGSNAYVKVASTAYTSGSATVTGSCSGAVAAVPPQVTGLTAGSNIVVGTGPTPTVATTTAPVFSQVTDSALATPSANVCASSAGNGKLVQTNCPPLYNANSYTSLQAALTASDGHGCLYIPAQTYSLSAALTGDNQTCIIGDGPSSVISGSVDPLIDISYNVTNTGPVMPRLSNFRIQALGSNRALVVQNLGGQAHTSAAIITNVAIDARSQSTPEPAVQIIDQNPIIIDNMDIYGAVVTGNIGLDLQSPVAQVSNLNVAGFDTDIKQEEHGTDGYPQVQYVAPHTQGGNTALNILSGDQDSVTAFQFDNCVVSCVTTNGSVDNFSTGTMVLSAPTNSGAYAINVANTAPNTFANINLFVSNAGNGFVNFAPNSTPVVGQLDMTHITATYGGTESCGVNLGPGMGRNNYFADWDFNNGAGFTTGAFCWNSTAFTSAYGYGPALILRDIYGNPHAPNYPPGSVTCPTVASATWEWNPQPYDEIVNISVSGGSVSDVKIAPPNGSGGEGTATDLGAPTSGIFLPVGSAIEVTNTGTATYSCYAR